MKVFLAATSLRPAYGGPAYSVSRLAAALGHAGLDIGLWSSDGSATDTSLLDDAAPVRRLGGSAAEAMRAFGAVDVVHDNGIWMPHNHRLTVLAAELKVPRVVSTRGMLEPWAINHKKLKKRVAWRLYQRGDLVSAQCLHATGEPEFQTIEQLHLGVRAIVVPNGIDIPPQKGGDPASLNPERAPDALRTVLFLGRIYPVKGLPMLIEAWSRVRPAGWRLKIAGPDESGHRAVVERAVSVAGLDDQVMFLGPLAEEAKRAALLDAELFVLPTHSESFGVVVAEALAHSLPVLTTTAAPWSMLVDHGCGWWVEPTVDGITEGLRQSTAMSTGELAGMGEKGREVALQRFRWEEVARQFTSAYQLLLGSRDGGYRPSFR
ncbi:MAG: glycosyltransferase [Gemmatimonadaceae bacterium]